MAPTLLLLSSELPPGPGGIGTHAHQLAAALTRRGWKVTVAAPQELAPTDEITAFNANQPFEIRRLLQPPGAPLKLGYRLAAVSALIRRRKPTLIVASGERMVWLAALLRPLHRVPFVAIGHAMEFNVPERWHRELNRRAFEQAIGVVSVSRYTESKMLASGIRTPFRAVIPNGADDARFGLRSSDVRDAFRRRHGLSDARIVITVGSVHERKGQDVVIRALPRILAKHPDVHYVAVGHPYKQTAFRELARTLGVEQRVHFLGAVSSEEVVCALNAADLFVMASQHTSNGDFEGYGIAVVEAALCGRAAVVADSSGVCEAIEPGETGLVAKISDPVSTADRVNELLANPARLAAMGELARERAQTQKTWEVRCAHYDRVLHGLVGGRPT